jgi:hypothetical protein
MSRTALVVTCLLAAPAALTAQGGSQSRLAGRLDAGTASAVSRVIDSASAAGVPSDPLIAKALEGASKHATGDRIVAAGRGLAADLASARQALGGSASEADVVAGASALRAGASTAVLAEIRAARGNAPLLVPLATLADLIAQGIPVDRAAATVLGLARAGSPDAAYRSAAGSTVRGFSAPGPDAGGRAAPAAAAPGPPPTAAHGGRPPTPGRPR